MSLVISIDLEDWFQVENLRPIFPPEIWEKQEVRIEKNIELILGLLEKYNVKATFFVLGWIAERYPFIIKKISTNGHEIASHGYNHLMLYTQSDKDVKADIEKSKKLLEDIIGKNIIGYRAPAFSITESSLDILNNAGFLYDSSLFPFSNHDRYGKISLDNFKKVSSNILVHSNGIKEFLLPTNKLFSKDIPWAGGGYFRLIPYFIYKKGIEDYLKKHENFIFYLHPWEFDYTQKRINGISKFNYFRHYYGLKSTYSKFEKLLQDFHKITTTFEQINEKL